MKLTVYRLKILENVVTLIITGVVILGLYWLSGSFHSLWALLILLNINDYWTYV